MFSSPTQVCKECDLSHSYADKLSVFLDAILPFNSIFEWSISIDREQFTNTFSAMEIMSKSIKHAKNAQDHFDMR